MKKIFFRKGLVLLTSAFLIVGGIFASVRPAMAVAPNWNSTGSYVVAFNYLGTDYPHDMTLSQDGLGNLTGNGGSPVGANTYTWVIDSGSVSGDTIDFTSHYTATPDAVTPLTTMNVIGTIVPGGTMSGTWSDNYNGGSRAGTWTTTSGNAVAISPIVPGPICTVPGDYATIGLAVNDVNCTTINVAAGIYLEHVAVNRSVIINGANVGVAGNATRGAESIVDGADTGTPFAITANNVTINGFTIQNGSGGGLDSGIWSQTGTQNSSVLNNIIKNNDFGVWAQCGGNCLIQNNLFDANNKPGAGSGSASISADSTTGLTINNNEFKNDTAGNPILLQAVAAGAHTNIIVSNNTMHDNTNSNVYVLGVTGGTFSGNTITPAIDATGFSFSGADTNITVTKNVITNGARGVRIEDAGYYGAGGANNNITVNKNSLASDSEYGVGNTDVAITNLDATCNWWGAANGPGPVGAGSGSKVTTNVNFTAWLTTSDLNGPCGGPVVTPPPSSGGGGGGGSGPAVCADGLDNDNDGLVDSRDPGCHSDGNANNPNSWVLLNNSEVNGQVLGVTTTTSQGQVLGAEKFFFTLFLKMGPPYHFDSWGNEVIELQKFLNGNGYSCGAIDGLFGSKTDSCVRAFQSANPPLKVDGIVGPRTREVLNR